MKQEPDRPTSSTHVTYFLVDCGYHLILCCHIHSLPFLCSSGGGRAKGGSPFSLYLLGKLVRRLLPGSSKSRHWLNFEGGSRQSCFFLFLLVSGDSYLSYGLQLLLFMILSPATHSLFLGSGKTTSSCVSPSLEWEWPLILGCFTTSYLTSLFHNLCDQIFV